jgi:methyl-accepting chemotaxis protein
VLKRRLNLAAKTLRRLRLRARLNAPFRSHQMRDYSSVLSLKTQMLCVGGAGVAGILITAAADFLPEPWAKLALPLLGAALPLAVAAVLGTRLALRAGQVLQSLRNPGTEPAPDLKGSDELADIARLLAEEQRRFRQQRQYLLETGSTLKGTALEVQAACGEAQQGARRQHLAIQDVLAGLPVLEHAQAESLSTVTALRGEAEAVATLAGQKEESVEAMAGLLARADEGLADSEAALTMLAEEGAQISQVLAAFDAMAEEISLIALNASLESARAGAAGQGVAVMADEVAGLASRARHFSEDFGRTLAKLESGAQAAVEPLKRGRALVETGRSELVGLRETCSSERAGLQTFAEHVSHQVQDFSTTLEITALLADTLGEAGRSAAESEEKVFRVSQRTRTLLSLIDAQHVSTVNLGEARANGRSFAAKS